MLRVWLPLNGDLHNQGTSNYTISVFRGTETYDNNGKIGKCFYAHGTNALKILNILPDIYNYSAYSLCAWCYIEAQNTSHSGSGIISGGNWNNQLLNLAMSDWSSDHYTKLRISGSNWNRTYNYNFYKNTWYHIVVCDDGTHTYGYVNGVLIGDTAASFLPTSIEGTDICIGGATYYAGMQFFGKINDVRIYDHCLSAAEVREISQGLVLHYKLDDTYAETTTNLYSGTFSNTCYNGATNKYSYGTTTDMYKTTGNFQGKESVKVYMGTAGLSAYPYVYFDAFNTTGTAVHTLSFDYYPTSQTSIIPYSYNGSYNISYITSNGAHDSKTNISSITIPVVINQWNHIAITMQKYDTTNTSRGNGYIRIGSASHTSTTSDYWLFANIQVEAKDHETGYTAPGTTRSNVQIQDSSGYGNNGIINSNPIISLETARYNYSISFDGVDDCIIVPYNTICPENIFTINLWFKKDALGSKSYETLFGGPSGFEMDTRAGSATSLSLYMASTRSGKRNAVTSLSLGNWYMVTMTRDGTKEKYYINGIFQSEIDAKTMPTGVYRIGAWASNTGQNYYGLISDFRIYCTALDADAIRQLYEVGAKVDNKQNLHTFELIETNKQETTKQGQIKGQNLLETYLPLYDKNIYTEPDGSTWIHIFHHNNPANSKFNETTLDWTTGKYLDTDRWYDVDQAIYYTLSPYEFMVKQKTTSSAAETKYRWVQMVNPLIAVWADVKPGTVTFNTSSGYTSSSHGGMYLSKSSNLHMCIANSNSGNWYGGIGVAAAYNGGIPGYPNTTVTTGYIDLYMRVYNGTKIIKNIGISSTEFIEL